MISNPTVQGAYINIPISDWKFFKELVKKMGWEVQTREELLAGLPEAMQTRILRGEVVPGMNEKAVLLAYGPPPACRTPDRHNGTWIYWRTKNDIIRLVFRADRVRTIINAGQHQ